MSDEFEDSQDLVTPDLAVFESQLRSLPVSGSKLNRNEMLYQAGWSAALAAKGNRSLGASPNLNWKISTGALATLAAVLAIMLFQRSNLLQQRQPGIAINSSEANENETGLDSNTTVPTSDTNDRLVRGPAMRTPNVINRNWQHSFVFPENELLNFRPLPDPTRLTARSNIRQRDWTTMPVYEINDQPASKSKTTMELLREMVPMENRKTNEKPIWDWLSRNWGERI